jgi:hypothetical protein
MSFFPEQSEQSKQVNAWIRSRVKSRSFTVRPGDMTTDDMNKQLREQGQRGTFSVPVEELFGSKKKGVNDGK